MKKLFVAILVLAAIGIFGVNSSLASDQETTPLETCETLAIEQNIVPEDVEQFINDCLAEMEENAQESSQEDNEIEAAQE